MADVGPLLDNAPDREVRPSRSSVALGLARAKLKTPSRKEPLWKLLAGAGLAATAALALAAAVILGPPTSSATSAQADVNPWLR
jgi:hypothetical protein